MVAAAVTDGAAWTQTGCSNEQATTGTAAGSGLVRAGATSRPWERGSSDGVGPKPGASSAAEAAAEAAAEPAGTCAEASPPAARAVATAQATRAARGRVWYVI